MSPPTNDCQSPPRRTADAGDAAFLTAAALFFAASVAATVFWCASMSAMRGMRMPGGWTMSMAWMRMPGQTRVGAAATFLGMWTVMMVAMMLPSLLPRLLHFRRRLGAQPQGRRARLTAAVTAGYFGVWTGLGLLAYPVGVALAAAAMHRPALARAVPLLIGASVLLAGALQCAPWKARRLARCAAMSDAPTPVRTGVGAAFRLGLRVGLDCLVCCGPLTAMLFAGGVMDLAAMASVTVAISLERLTPRGARLARLTGALAVGAGLVLLASALLRGAGR